MKCWYCETDLNEKTKSDEHIIPNCLGSNFHSKLLICGNCNKSLNEFDKVLDKQLGDFAAHLGVKNRNKSAQKKHVTLINDKGEIIRSRPALKGSISLNIYYSNNLTPKRVDFMSMAALKAKLNELSQKEGYTYDDQNAHYKEIMHFTNTGKPDLFTFGNNNFWKSLIKISVNYFVYLGGKRKYVLDSINVIKVGDGFAPISMITLYHPQAFNIKLPHFDILKDTIYHSLHINGDPTTKILYCQIELFTFFKVLVILNTNYSGETIKSSFHYDLISENRVDIPFYPIDKPREFFLTICKIRSAHSENEMKKQLEKVIGIMKVRMEEIIGKVLDE